MFASSRKALPLLSWWFIFIALHHVCQSALAMKESTTISLSSQTQKHDMFDTFGFDSKSSSMTFQKLKMKILGGEDSATPARLPKVYLSLCPLNENANLANEASASDANGAWCEVSVGKLNETNACRFVAFAGEEEEEEEEEEEDEAIGERRRRSGRRRSLLTGGAYGDDDDRNVVFEKEYAPMQIKVNEKKVYDIAFFTCDSKGTTIEIDVAYETLNGGKHHLSTEWQPVVSVFLYILLCYVIFFMLQLTHTMSMCAIYRSQSVISALHYAMWTTQVMRMIHVSMSFNHFNYIDVNGTVNDSFYHGVIICSSLKEMTFWTLLLAIGGGWRVTSNRASRERKIIGGVTMFMIFTTNLVGQMNLGIRTVYFVYALTYCGVISMTLYVSSKTIRTLHEQLEIFRRSGATEEEVARAPVRTKERMYQTFYVAFIVFCGLKIMNQILSTYFERDHAWVQLFFSEFIDMMLWCFLLILFRPKDQTYTTSFPANGFDPFGFDASVRAAEMGVHPREGLTYLPDIYVAEVSAASKIEREFLHRTRNDDDVVVTGIASDQSSDSGGASRSSTSVDSIELSARGVMSKSAPAEESSTSTLSSLADGGADVEQGLASQQHQSIRARMNVYVIENPPTTKGDGAPLSESIALAIKIDDIEAHRALEKRERSVNEASAAAAVLDEQEEGHAAAE